MSGGRLPLPPCTPVRAAGGKTESLLLTTAPQDLLRHKQPKVFNKEFEGGDVIETVE